MKNEKNEIIRMTVRSEQEGAEQMRALKRRYPAKRVTFNCDYTLAKSTDVQLRMRAGIDLGLLALKMCVAQATLFSDFTREDVKLALQELKYQPMVRMKCCRRDHNIYTAIEGVRKPLSHSIFVERNGPRVYGIVSFFGVIQMYCQLGVPTDRRDSLALLGSLDWLSGKEQFIEVEPQDLKPPQEFTPKSHSHELCDGCGGN